MDNLPLDANPFALMMNPEIVIQAVEKSERLNRLNRRVCRPLDKPLIGVVADEPAVDDAALDAPASSDA